MAGQPPRRQLEAYKSTFLELCIRSEILTFGSFTLKSGRVSPYFFNAGLFNTATLISSLSTAFAKTVLSADGHLRSTGFDVIFGPAYKGIPLAAVTCAKLGELEPNGFQDVGYSFNRKEKKDHGEGGGIVGMPLKGKKVLVIDDVITAGTAMGEAVEIIKAAEGTLVGIVLCLDRQERMTDGTMSAIENCRKMYGVPVEAILTLDDIIEGITDEEQRKRMEEYRRQYSPS